VSVENENTPIEEGVMRLITQIPSGSISRGSIPLAFIVLGACTTHPLRCDAHLTPINSPVPPAATTDVKPSERGTP
jgi:hypothetical protein